MGGVHIGNNVFIGTGSIVLPGTIIGDDCIIGAGSIVRGSIPSDSLVIGNPAQIVGSTSQYISRHKERLEKQGVIDLTKEDIEKIGACDDRGYVL